MAWTLLLSCCSSSTRSPPPLSLPPPPNPSNRLRRSLIPRVSEAKQVELPWETTLGGGRRRRRRRRSRRVLASRGRVACPARRGADAEESSAAAAGPPAAAAAAARRVIRAALWAAEAAYIVWLFLLPYAPGDPVWAIKPSTINDLLGLSLNFFFILPLMNSVGAFYGSVVGIHVIEAPVLHPMAEGLFNFVIGWTFLFAPLLFTDRQRDRYKGSLDLLWGCQMFLTNVFLIPYMAARLNDANPNQPPTKPSQLGLVMVRGAPIVGIIGGLVCVVSTLWALFGRADGGFGGLADRWLYLGSYIGSERLAYAFIWDILLYAVFQPWLIGDNLHNVKRDYTELVNVLRFIPFVGLVAYLLCLDNVKEFLVED